MDKEVLECRCTLRNLYFQNRWHSTLQETFTFKTTAHNGELNNGFAN